MFRKLRILNQQLREQERNEKTSGPSCNYECKVLVENDSCWGIFVKTLFKLIQTYIDMIKNNSMYSGP